MPTSGTTLYVYRARNERGRVVRGKLHASTEAEAVETVQAQGLVPLWVRDNRQLGVMNRELDIAVVDRQPKTRDLAIAAKQLSVMIGSGVTLLRSLEILAEQTANKVLAQAFSDVRREVGQGSSFASALERRNRIFPPLLANLVRVGEAGGFLDEALESASRSLETDLRLQQKVKAAMAYPVVVLIVALIAIIVMLTVVVPMFENLFAGFGQELPLPTQVLISLSHSTPYWVPALLIAIIVAVFWYRRHQNDAAVRRAVGRAKVNAPIFGQLFRKVAIARFARNLAVMLTAGVPMLQAIALVSRVSNNWVIEQALLDAEDAVRHGKSFASPLAQHDVFPPMVTQMVAVGEDSGSLDTMLTSIADFYDREVETAADQLTSIIEPLLIVIVGAVIGSMVVALYLPIFTMSSAIQGM